MRWPSTHVLALALVAAATLPTMPAGACPRSELGAGTSQAWLERVEYDHVGRDHTLVLHLSVEDAPVAERIQVDGQPHTAAIEHFTPMTLARWTERVTLLFGGASKFLLGTVEDLDTGDVAVIPFSALRSLTVAQGSDFDDNAPYSVRVELALLQAPAPFDGERRPFEPLFGVEQVEFELSRGVRVRAGPGRAARVRGGGAPAAHAPDAVPQPWTARPDWATAQRRWLEQAAGAAALLGLCAGGLWAVRRGGSLSSPRPASERPRSA